MGFPHLISVEHAPYFGGQFGMGEGLPDEVRARIQTAMVDDGVRGVAGRKQNRKAGPELSHFVSDGAPVHATPQNHIREEQLDLGLL
jgi:hypothetical protein